MKDQDPLGPHNQTPPLILLGPKRGGVGGEDGGGEDGEGAWPTRGKIPFPSQNRDILPDIPHNRHVWVPSLFLEMV